MDMKKLLLLFPMFLFAAIAYGQNDSKLKIGDTAPDFSVKMLDGSVVNSADLKGKVIVLNFWATWCPSCRTELSRVDSEITNRFKGDDFVFIAISRGEARETVENFRRMTNHKFSIGLDTDSSIFNKFAEKMIPRVYIIGRDGKIAAAHTGYSNAQFQELVSDIDKTLKSK